MSTKALLGYVAVGLSAVVILISIALAMNPSTRPGGIMLWFPGFLLAGAACALLIRETLPTKLVGFASLAFPCIVAFFSIVIMVLSGMSGGGGVIVIGGY